MNRSIVRRLLLGAVLVALVGALPGGALARGPRSTAAGWQLVDNHQSACFNNSRASATSYGIWIKGKWTHSIEIGAAGLPAGASFSTSYAPIAAGSSSGIYSLAYVDVQLKRKAAVGTYTASLWATDGTSSQSVNVTMTVQSRCGY